MSVDKSIATELISIFRLCIKLHSPFFSVLAYNCKFVPIRGNKIAATDGTKIYFNTEHFSKLKNEERNAMFLHEVLHIVLGHVGRLKDRDMHTWNIACDITVNYIISKLHYCKLPDDAVQEPDLWRDTTEEIYELLKKNPDVVKKYEQKDNWLSDLISSNNNNKSDVSLEEEGQFSKISAGELAEAEALWKDLVDVAKQEQKDKSSKFSNLPAELMRVLELIAAPQLDWKQMLMNYLVSMPTDYEGYERRFISQGLYCDAVDGQSVCIDVCIDTSGSISQKDLAMFASELQGILVSYPHIDCNLYWADTKAYGPYPIERIADLPKPQGGGGTSFEEFFLKRLQNTERIPAPIAVYLTDGYGYFPEPPEDVSTLWICNSNKKAADFPFGTVVHLST
jgi:predicted metal-dependent peptidase